MDNGTKKTYVFIEQIKLFAQYTPSLAGLNIMMASIISLILLEHANVGIPLFFFATMVLLNIFRLWHYGRLKKNNITSDSVVTHRNIYVFLSFASGAVWGSLGLLDATFTEIFLLILVATLLCGMVAGSVTYLSAYKPAYFAFAIACVFPFVVRCLISQEKMLIGVGVMMLLFLIVNLFNGRLAHQSVLKGIHLALENEQLIEKLKTEKQNADDARAIADKKNESKSRYLAAASHDLRQPLHAMVFFVEALQHEKNQDKIKLLVKRISQTSEFLRKLLGSLLDISKIEAGVIEPRLSSFMVNDMLKAIVQEFSEQAHEKKLDLDFKPCDVAVYSDKEMLGRILRNLVSNAIRYTEMGYVNISCEREHGYVAIHVSDSGLGIPEGDKEAIFNEFYQSRNGKNSTSRGLGLGLSIVDGLCKLLDHKMTLHSEQNLGSVFSIKVPLGNISEISKNKPILSRLPGDIAANTILLSNDAASRESTRDLLQHWGYVVADFISGKEALDFLETEHFDPDIIISDSELRGESGIKAVEAIQTDISRMIPGIILVDGPDNADINIIKGKGYSVLQKPVKPAKLRSTVSYLLQKKKMI